VSLAEAGGRLLASAAGFGQRAGARLLRLHGLGVTQKDVNTWAANWDIWQKHGFERPAWDNAVSVPKGHFRAKQVRQGARASRRVFHFLKWRRGGAEGPGTGMEAPGFTKVAVNGKPCRSPRQAMAGPHMKSLGVEKIARTGVNEVTIQGLPST